MDEATLLLVDDEANILSALKRLLRPQGHQVLTAQSGAQALELMAAQPVDLVISDMRMPEMDGARLLEEVRLRSPDTVRVLLTGYADLDSTVAAINRGEIWRYLAKPWEENDVLLTVRQGLERRFLESEKRRLEALTQTQNEELKQLNAGLEEKVRARTEEIRQMNGFLEAANRQLKENFMLSMRIFSNLIELRHNAIAGHSRRVAEHARALAQAMAMKPGDVQDVLFAALLHDVGKIGLPDKLLARPWPALDEEERRQVMQHPLTGQAALMGIEALRNAGAIVRSHHERFDGLGYPDGLQGTGIPQGARILAVVNDYDALLQGNLQDKRLTLPQAREFLLAGKGKRYDPRVVDSFIRLLGEAPAQSAAPGVRIASGQLRPGMVLARDLIGKDGLLLLARDYLLDEALIAQIRGYEESLEQPMEIHIRA